MNDMLLFQKNIYYFNSITTTQHSTNYTNPLETHQKNPYEKSNRNPHEKPIGKSVGSAPICHLSAAARLLLIWVRDLSEEESLGRTRK